MFSRLLALRFFHIYLTQRFANITVKTHCIAQNDGTKLHFDEYFPTNRCAGSMVFTHGMTRTAHHDARVVVFAKAMATVGFRLLVPLYPRIQAPNIQTDSVNDIAQSLETLLQQGYAVHEKLSIFSVSFSGAQALRAISRPSIAPHINALLALGTANRYTTAFEKILAPGSTADTYVQMLLLRNIILLAEPEMTNILDPVLNAAIDDAYEFNDPSRLSAYGDILPPTTRAHYQNLLNMLFVQHSLFERYADTVKKLQQQFENSGNLEGIQADISLIHSIHDRVLMPTESETLHQELTAAQVKSRLTLTPLMDHVNTQFSWRQIGQAWRLLTHFQHFSSMLP